MSFFFFYQLATVMGLKMNLKANEKKKFINSLEWLSFIFQYHFVNYRKKKYLNLCINCVEFSISEGIIKRFMNPLAHVDFIYKKTNLYKQQQEHLNNIRYLTDRVSFFCFVFKCFSFNVNYK